MAQNEDMYRGQRPRLSSDQTSALENMRDVYPMPSVAVGRPPVSDELYEGFQRVDNVPAELYKKYDVKRGLRNADGSGVLVGLTTISNVHGYNKTENGIEPDEGRLTIRGYDIADLVHNAQAEDRFGYEEVSYLLLTGSLPTEAQLVDFRQRIDSRRQLPTGYLHVFPRTTASPSIMNILQQSTLLLYSFDPTPDDTSPEHEIDVAVSQLARLPRVAAIAYAAHRANKFGEPLFVPPVREGYSMAETVLDVLRGDEGFTHDEAMLLDVMLMLHAEHGGANYKAGEMIQDIGYHVRDWADDEEIYAYLSKILRKEAFDGKGLIYGLGHAVYTKTDPRATIVKEYARRLAAQKGVEEKLNLIASVERLGPKAMREVRGITKPISTNIDMYTGFVYSMLGVPKAMFTPIFAIARMSGWAAHRMEELYGAGRIIRPAYRSYMTEQEYLPIGERG